MSVMPHEWLLRRSPALMLLLDGEGLILDASDQWLRRFGYPREAVVGKRPHDFSSAAVAERIVSEYVPLLRRTGELEAVPVDIITSSGEVVDCLARAVVEHDADGEFLRTVTVYSELGEHARLEQQYRDLYRATPGLLHTVDAQGRILHVSDRWLSKLGYTREEVLGRYITDFMGEEIRENLSGDRLSDIIATGVLDNEPRTYVTKAGDVIEVLISAAQNATRAAP